MKKSLLLLALCSSFACAQEKVMTFIGDSITHGFGTPGYRYEFWKILEDNKIPHRMVGVNQGNTKYANGNSLTYNEQPFSNVHCAGSSWRTYQTSGDYMNNGHQRGVGPNTLPSLGYIMTWLDLEDAKSYDKLNGKKLKKGEYFNNGVQQYKGTTLTGKDLPDVFFIMLGTNDLYSDSPGSEDNPKTFGYLKNIIESVRLANPKAQFVVLSMPTVTARKNKQSDTITGSYNDYIKKHLKELQKPKSSVSFADINPGITLENNFMADVMASDGLHPNAQGNLIIAGNLAKAMNYPQRTAGLQRFTNKKLPVKTIVKDNKFLIGGQGLKPTVVKASEGSSPTYTVAGSTINFNANSGTSQTMELPWKSGESNTLHFTIKLNGKDDTNCCSVRMGDSGLNVYPDRIEWQGEKAEPLVYTNTENKEIPLTISFKAEKGAIPTGYYIWMGDQLIGEAKQGSENQSESIRLGSLNDTNPCKAKISGISGDFKKAWAPPSHTATK